MQRVTRAEVRVDGAVVGKIAKGLCVLVAAGQGDTDDDVSYLVDKCINLRIFEDEAGKMNRSLLDVGGGLLAVSQFTLYGDVRKGRRPSFTDAMEPVEAARRYEQFVAGCRAGGVADVQTGVFRAMMEVELVNWGPVTMLLDSRGAF